MGATTIKRPTRPLNEVFGLPFTQADIDFVMPDLAGDVRVGIDPFLLFKSRDPDYALAHEGLLQVFNEAIQAYARGSADVASRLLDFPEVNEIGLGYRSKGLYGSGLGRHLNNLLLQTLSGSPALVARGLRHVEELQLVTLGINADRVSDISANILKSFLIDYTQRQADTYSIPLTRGVPVEHVFDFDDWTWSDGYYDLPANPLTPRARAILLVPRRIVRLLPWINYDDYQRMEFPLFLRAKQARRPLESSEYAAPLTKAQTVPITRREIQRVDHYVDIKERDSAHADPAVLVPPTHESKAACEQLIVELQALGPGPEDAYQYQALMFRIVNRLFEPDLIEGRKQSRTEHGTEIRDLLYTNDSDKPFWDFARNTHGSLTVVVECKNTQRLQNSDIDQLAGYLGDALGYLGFILTRSPLSSARQLKCIAWYNKGAPHRVILVVEDAAVVRMLQMKAAGKDPTQIVPFKYQELMARIQ